MSFPQLIASWRIWAESPSSPLVFHCCPCPGALQTSLAGLQFSPGDVLTSWWPAVLTWWFVHLSWWPAVLPWWFADLSWWPAVLSWWLADLSWWPAVLSWWFADLSWWPAVLSWWVTDLSRWPAVLSWCMYVCVCVFECVWFFFCYHYFEGWPLELCNLVSTHFEKTQTESLKNCHMCVFDMNSFRLHTKVHTSMLNLIRTQKWKFWA